MYRASSLSGGSQTSHAAILARGRGIPAVAAVTGILRQVKTGRYDRRRRPQWQRGGQSDPEALSAYLKLQREFFDLQDQLAENRDDPAVTADGTELQLLSNINDWWMRRLRRRWAPAAVGLFRTEFIYLTPPTFRTKKSRLKSIGRSFSTAPTGGSRFARWISAVIRPCLIWAIRIRKRIRFSAGVAFGYRSNIRSFHQLKCAPYCERLPMLDRATRKYA